MVVIHAHPGIRWQREKLGRMVAGLEALGVPYSIATDRVRRDGELPILFGTTHWRSLEVGDFLLVDRCSFGDTERFVSLVRNGHGRRGDHRVPANPCPSRWERHGVPVQPWRTGRQTILCGQHESYSPRWPDLKAWYAAVRGECTHFRAHPAADNPTGLPATREWSQAGRAITLNSSVGVSAILAGVPTRTDDEGAMAWPGFEYGADREPWLHWLAWTQWTWDEIAEGHPWAHLL